MTTIPADLFVNVTPSVVSPGGAALATVGLQLSYSRRVPIGSVYSFASAPAEAAFFGSTSVEAILAPYYYGGFVNSPATPGAQLHVQFPITGAPAWLQGGNISTLTIPQLQGISGTLSVVMDGYTYTSASVVLSGDTSFSAAAATIQTALNTSLPAGASVTGSIAAVSGTFTGSIAGNVMSVTSVPADPIVPGATITGTGVTSGTEVVNQLSGTANGIGTYAVSKTQSVASETLTAAYGTLTVTAEGSGSLSVGQTLSGSGVTSGTQVTGLGTGTGGTGTYYVTPSQTVVSDEAITSTGSALAVTFDSVSGGFLITSGQTGPSAGTSTAAFATGTAAAPLLLTQATGAIVSQGAVPQSPAAFMNGITALTQDWFSFYTAFDPDDAQGAVGQNAVKMQFAQWTSQQKNTPFAYIAEDTDISPSESVPAASSMGNLLPAQNLTGTVPIWNPNGAMTVNANPFGSRAAFISGACNSVNFNQTNGRATYAFKSSPAGLIADVTTQTTAINLAGNPQNAGNGQPTGGNGYNFYGSVGSAAQNFIFFSPGSISGPFKWLDGYLDQAYMNASFQDDGLQLLTSIGSLPYNPSGYALYEEALAPTINQMLNYGAIRTNVPLSASQAQAVNNNAGVSIAPTLSTRGWYLQVLPATALVRAARGAPPSTFWYTDGGSIQALSLNSVDVL